MVASHISVLVVDDSPVVRKVLSQILSEDPLIRDVYTAPSGKLALRKIKKLDPDIVTMDVEMPELDGLATLKIVMAEFPRPVIMVSAATHRGAEKTLEALELGAVDFIPKPVGRLSREVQAIGDELKAKIHGIMKLERKRKRRSLHNRPVEGLCPERPRTDRVPLPIVERETAKRATPPEVVAIGASTGGTEAIRRVLESLPADFAAAIVLVQHMPENFTASFAARLNGLSAITVKEAAHRDLLLPGRALLAPGHSHLVVRRGELGPYVELLENEKVSGHRPSVDVLFDSVAEVFGPRALGVLLTGMGRDGASGMGSLNDAGALTIAQSEDTCVVFGMPKAAIQAGSVTLTLNLSDIGETVALSARRPANNRPRSPQRTQPGQVG